MAAAQIRTAANQRRKGRLLRLLLHFKLGLSRAALRHIDFSFHLSGERVPGKDLVLTGWNILNLERAVFLRDSIEWIPHRHEESLHELVLIALQAILGTRLFLAA